MSWVAGSNPALSVHVGGAGSPHASPPAAQRLLGRLELVLGIGERAPGALELGGGSVERLRRFRVRPLGVPDGTGGIGAARLRVANRRAGGAKLRLGGGIRLGFRLPFGLRPLGFLPCRGSR